MNQETLVLHAQAQGNNHVVGIKTLHVWLTRDDSGCFAQGLEIDYAAAGQTIEEAKSNFEKGLSLTIEEHLKMHGTVAKLLKIAPQAVWDEYFSEAEAHLQSYSALEAFNIEPFPFESIEFLGSRSLAA